jgi:radical SAM superfamily enzyme YgiQ (UPF0313 family)
MRALLVYPAFPKTFFSFDSAIKMRRAKGLEPPLGLLTLAALLPREWELKLFDLSFQEIHSQDWENCDLVLVSGMVVQHRGILEVIKEGKRRSKTVVVGGPWAFHLAEMALETGADLVVVGEGEVAVPQLVEHLQEKKLGSILRANGFANLEDVPAPRYDLIQMDHYVEMAVQFSRGCPFHCEFCDVTLMSGHRVRTKTVEQIMMELELLYQAGWRRNIFFVDDNFIGSPHKAKELLRALVQWMDLKGHPFRFGTQASMNLGADDELLDLMVRAGFYYVFLGVETLDERSLKQAGKTPNVGVDIELACRKINRAGLAIIAGCIVGFDNEASGADRRLIEFARRNHIPDMFVTMLQAGPGTALWERLEKEGRTLPITDFDHLSNNTGLINFTPTRPVRQIVEEFINAYQVLYEPGFYLERTFHHIECMVPCEVYPPFRFPYFSELFAVWLIILKQGVLSTARRKFWKFLFEVVWKFPRRLDLFLTYCIKGEHYFEYKEIIKKELELQVAKRTSQGSPGLGSENSSPGLGLGINNCVPS